jgi:hypothetical protein
MSHTIDALYVLLIASEFKQKESHFKIEKFSNQFKQIGCKIIHKSVMWVPKKWQLQRTNTRQLSCHGSYP